MGIRRETIHLIEYAVNELGGYHGLRMCELGNQIMKGLGGASAKYHFTQLGVEHVSIDKNELDGAIARDLEDDLSDLGEFDLVTNYGTSEHVKDQYQVFRNIHKLTRKNGLMVHALPMIGSWDFHGFYGYDAFFLDTLARESGYHAHKIELIPRELEDDNKRWLVCGVLEKQRDEFISREKFEGLGGIVEYVRSHSKEV